MQDTPEGLVDVPAVNATADPGTKPVPVMINVPTEPLLSVPRLPTPVMVGASIDVAVGTELPTANAPAAVVETPDELMKVKSATLDPVEAGTVTVTVIDVGVTTKLLNQEFRSPSVPVFVVNSKVLPVKP